MHEQAHSLLLSTLSLLLVSLPAGAQREICTLDQSQESAGCSHEIRVTPSRWQEFVPSCGTVCEIGFDLVRVGDPGDVRVSLLDPENPLALCTEYGTYGIRNQVCFHAPREPQVRENRSGSVSHMECL